MGKRKRDKLDEVLDMVKKQNSKEGKEAARLAKMAAVKNPKRKKDDLAGDVTTGLGRTKKEMEDIARGGAQEFRNGGKVSLGNFKGNF